MLHQQMKNDYLNLMSFLYCSLLEWLNPDPLDPDLDAAVEVVCSLQSDKCFQVEEHMLGHIHSFVKQMDEYSTHIPFIEGTVCSGKEVTWRHCCFTETVRITMNSYFYINLYFVIPIKCTTTKFKRNSLTLTVCDCEGRSPCCTLLNFGTKQSPSQLTDSITTID